MWRVLPCAVTADIRESRHVRDRAELQRLLNAALSRANETFADALLAPFRITVGDEWQGLLQDVSRAFAVVRFFRNELYPYAARFGIGEGELSTPLVRDVTQMDGSVFHRSREALAEAKRGDHWLVFRTRDPATDDLLSSFSDLLGVLMNRWTAKQRERYFLLEKLGSQKAVAHHLGISLSAVNQSLRSSGALQARQAEMALERFLSAWGSGELAGRLLKGE